MYTNKYNPIIDVGHFYFSSTNTDTTTISPNRIFSIPSQKTTRRVSSCVQTGADGRVFPNSVLIPDQSQKISQNEYNWGAVAYSPNILLLTPVIFGGAAVFILGFNYYGHTLSGGYNKYLFFAIIFAIIVTLGTGAFIYEARRGQTTLSEVIVPAILLILFFAGLYNLTYSLYPQSFSGTIGDTPITQFLSFLSISIGSVSVGETLNVTPEQSATQIMVAIEALFALFVLSLIISLVA